MNQELLLQRVHWKQNLKEFPRLISIGAFSNGFVSWLFGCTGPLLIVLQAAAQGHLGMQTTSSWIFAIYFVGGLLSILLSVFYRQPIGYAFSIPGALIVGSSLAHHTYGQVIGAYLTTGVIILVLGMTGVVNKLMNILPMPVMMGMVSGVLLPFGIDLFHAVVGSPLLNGVPLLVFLVLSFFKKVARKFPPILGAIVASVVMLKLTNGMQVAHLAVSVAVPQLVAPQFDMSTMGELVLPLVLTVIAIQNAQGIAVLKSTGYHAPVNSMTSWSGIGSLLNSVFGAHSACIAGPMTAILAGHDSGEKHARYVAAIFLGVLSCLFGLFAPVAATIPHLIPTSVIQLLGGLAMINVLTDSLQMSFSSKFKVSALFSFLITLSGVSLAHIGAPFWGLIGGTLSSLFLEKQDYARQEPSAERSGV